MDFGSVAILALAAGLAGGTIGAALVGTVEAMLRQRMAHSDRRRWSSHSRWVGSGSVKSPFERPDPDDGPKS